MSLLTSQADLKIRDKNDFFINLVFSDTMHIVQKIQLLSGEFSPLGYRIGRFFVRGVVNGALISVLTTGKSHQADLGFVRSLSGLSAGDVIKVLREHECHMSTINLTGDPATFELSSIGVSEIMEADSTVITWGKDDLSRRFTECLFGPDNKYLFIAETQSVVFNCDNPRLFDRIRRCKSAKELVDVVYGREN